MTQNVGSPNVADHVGDHAVARLAIERLRKQADTWRIVQAVRHPRPPAVLRAEIEAIDAEAAALSRRPPTAASAGRLALLRETRVGLRAEIVAAYGRDPASVDADTCARCARLLLVR
jgi:hypothetical protein